VCPIAVNKTVPAHWLFGIWPECPFSPRQLLLGPMSSCPIDGYLTFGAAPSAFVSLCCSCCLHSPHSKEREGLRLREREG